MSTPSAVSNYLSVMQSLYQITRSDDSWSKRLRKDEISEMRAAIHKQLAELSPHFVDEPLAQPISLIERPLKVDKSLEADFLSKIQHRNQTIEIAKSQITGILDDASPKEQRSVLSELLRTTKQEIQKKSQLEAQLAELNAIESRINLLNSRCVAAENEFDGVFKEIYRRSWAHLRNARIIDVPTTEFLTMQRAFARYGSGNPHKPVDNIPYPERVPFSDTYFSFGNGVLCESLGSETLTLFGVLITPALAAGVIRVKETDQVLIDCWYNDGSWRSEFWVPHSQALVIALVDLVNNYRTFVIEEEPTEATRIKYRQLAKRFIFKKPIPQPYYTIRLRSKIIHTSVYRTARQLAKYSIEYSYRFDVRGHERCKIQRGKLPIDAKTSKILTKRGYTIFDVGQPPEEIQKLLQSRQIPLRGTNEWLAIKIFWVSEHVKGPEDKPYVPAVRVLDQKNEHEPDDSADSIL